MCTLYISDYGITIQQLVDIYIVVSEYMLTI